MGPGWQDARGQRFKAEQNERDANERRKDQAARVFIPTRRDPVRLVRPYVKNASDFSIYDAEMWYADPGGMSGPDDLGMIMPSESVEASRLTSVAEALKYHCHLSRFGRCRWVRLPNGSLEQQARSTARESMLVALGVPMPPEPGSS